MKTLKRYLDDRYAVKARVSSTGRPDFAPQTAPSGTSLTRRGLLARLGLFTATLAVAPALVAKSPLPRSPKGAEQLMALQEYERLLDALPSEADCPVLNKLRQRYSSRPIEKRIVPATRSGRTAEIAVFQTGKIGADRVAVLVHGCLADHDTWRYVAGALGHDQELWMIDLPGCGESEGHPDHLEPDAFTPAAMAERIGIVLEARLADRSVRGLASPRLTLVGHSLGGMYSLRLVSAPALRRRFAKVREHLEALVLFAPCDVAVNSVPPSFLTLLRLNPAKVGVGDALGIVEDKIKQLTRDSYFQPGYATREHAEGFSRALTVPGHLRGAQAMVRGAVPWKLHANRPDWPAITLLQAEYANLDVPCLIAWGEWDETLSETMGHKIRDHVPRARLVEITGAGHSVISERPLACAHIIRTAQTAAAEGLFATLPPVCPYGQSPFDGAENLAQLG